MFGAILKATKSSFQKGMTFCRSIYVKKVMKLLAFIFEQPSYAPNPLQVGNEAPHQTFNLSNIISEPTYFTESLFGNK